MKEFLLDREFIEEEIDSYIEKLTMRQWKRLLSLLRGDVAMPFTFDDAFNSFTVHCPAWSNIDHRTLLFDAYPNYGHMKILRVQTTNICSAHADIVLVHLEKCIRAGPECALLMPDLTALLCRIYFKVGGKQTFIAEYVSGKHKISAVNFLRSVYGINSDQMDTIKLNVPTSEKLAERLLHDNKLLQSLLAQRPALLSFEFGVDFAVEGVFSYDGVPSCQVERDQGTKPPSHAMVIVGVRNEGAKYFYLCMNFWISKFFVELSDVYLARCNAVISTLHDGIPLEELLQFRNIPRFNGLSAETALDIDTDDELKVEDEEEEEEARYDALY